LYPLWLDCGLSALRERAHELEGNATLFGAESLRQSTQAVNRCLRSEQQEGLEQGVGQLKTALEELSGKRGG